ncbi:PadR family transcriptional regulator [Demequina phytophila]|uniref:PadR family transcriptional regulator n=1 Tax=Demequina phytophila TaxID=1638981 RepID=UPI000ACC4F93|nr:PadR family transcriptional regulator [Demequina phytophila]
MRHSHHHPGPRGFRGMNPGPAWAATPEPGELPEYGARRRRGGFGDHEGPAGFDGPRGRGRGGRHGGPGGPGHGPDGRGRGGRGGRPRGDVRVAILLLLADQPRHGYDLIKEIEERSGGAWVPSPGSIYPTLQVLEDEGLVTVELVDGRKTASLTESGEEWAAEHAVELDALFQVDDRKEQAIALRRELHELHEAVSHIVRRYDRPDVAAKATAVVATARRDLYRLLAEDGD